MYRDNEFYGIIDTLHYQVYASLLKEYMKYEERVIIKVFKKEEQIVVIETNNFKDVILMDTRVDKNDDLMEYDLIFLKVLERYASDYEIPGMVYETVEGLGSWFRVYIPSFSPSMKCLKPFFLKKKMALAEMLEYGDNDEEKALIEKFYNITKGLIRFSKPSKVIQMFERIYDDGKF